MSYFQCVLSFWTPLQASWQMLDRIALWEYRIKTVNLYGPAIWVIFYIVHTDNSRQTHTHSSFNMSIMTARLSTVLCVTMQHIHINDGKQTNMNLSGPTQIERKKGNLSCVHGTLVWQKIHERQRNRKDCHTHLHSDYIIVRLQWQVPLTPHFKKSMYPCTLW